jgi:hypothetical protein
VTLLNDVNFSNALPQLAGLVFETFGLAVMTDGIFVRDGFGRLSFYAPMAVKQVIKRSFDRNAKRALGLHVSPIAVLQDVDSPSYENVTTSPRFCVKLSMAHGDGSVNLVDRRFFGRDWLETPAPPKAGLAPIMVFNSIKGGVGRSTALFVLSIALSRYGKNVLLVDLDLEAPGLGSLIFQDDGPAFGVVDYLVESALGGVHDADLPLFVGSSSLTDRDVGQGRVDLIPATGSETAANPRTMMAKLSRALIDAPGGSGEPQPLIHKISEMIGRIAGTSQYDAILVDARAGLSEITASPILGLGAINLFFATDHPHSFEGYRYLLSHLSMLAVGDSETDWRRRVHFVHAKAKASAEARDAFDDRLYEVLAETFYEVDEGDEVFNFSYDDKLAPHAANRIFFSSEFVDADPLKSPSLLEEDVFNASFGSFLDAAFELLGFDGERTDEPPAF